MWIKLNLSLTPVHDYDTLVIENELMTFKECYFEAFSEFSGCTA
jgi:hypothetical protein